MVRTDPRPMQAQAFENARGAVAAVRPEQMTLPTPCSEYDVRALLGHIVAVLHKVAAVGHGKDPSEVPDVAEGIADDGWVAAFDAGAAEVRSAWADDALLDREFRLPWATLPGTMVVSIWAQELAIHGWDLAVAIGAPTDWDPEVGEAMLPLAHTILPAEIRGEPIGNSFAAVVDVPESAGGGMAGPRREPLGGVTSRRPGLAGPQLAEQAGELRRPLQREVQTGALELDDRPGSGDQRGQPVRPGGLEEHVAGAPDDQRRGGERRQPGPGGDQVLGPERHHQPLDGAGGAGDGEGGEQGVEGPAVELVGALETDAQAGVRAGVLGVGRDRVQHRRVAPPPGALGGGAKRRRRQVVVTVAVGQRQGADALGRRAPGRRRRRCPCPPGRSGRARSGG